MENVFGYFVAIGAGVSFGLTLGAIPAILVLRWIQKRGGGQRNAFQKNRS